MVKISKNRFTKEELSGVLRRVGYKATPARLAVLSVIKHSTSPLSAQGVIEKLGSDFDQATIYRTFKNLKKTGIIRQIDLRHNHAHYELADINDHHHLICIKCGRIEDITGCQIEDMYKSIINASDNFSQISQHSLEFYGICKRCLK